MRSVLVSTYEVGRQPFGLGAAAAWLRARGWDVTMVDAAKERLEEHHLASAEMIGFHLPMHTATRLAAPIVATARRVNPSAGICAFGLYAPLNAEWLRALGADAVFGGEFEEDLAAFADHVRGTQSPQSSQSIGCRSVVGLADEGSGTQSSHSQRSVPAFADLAGFAFHRRDTRLPKIHFLVPDRTGLP